MKTSQLLYIGIATVLLGFSSCSSDFLDAEYTDGVDSETATDLANRNPEALNGYLNGAYVFMTKSNIQEAAPGDEAHDDFSFMSIVHATDMMTEDIVQSSSHWFTYDYDFDNRMNNYRRTKVNWKTLYTLVSKANEIMDFFPEEPENADSKGVLGQAYAIRGFSYYYLIQLYQRGYTGEESQLSLPGVPMRYSKYEGLTEEERLERTGRNTMKDVFDQIESDLTKAIELLEAGYRRPSKIYIDASVAHGLLARFYLLTRNWENAVTEAQKAGTNYPPMSSASLHDGFMDIQNSEWMWGFDHSTESQTTYASFFSHISNIAPGYAGIGYAPRLIDARLYSQISDTDERKTLFNDPQAQMDKTHLPYANLKFGWDGNWTMDYMYMRGAEMILIEAEALAHQGKNGEAANALSKLMKIRDTSWNMASVTVEDVHLQRRIELWGEGFAYFDLKRLNKGIDRNYSGSNHRAGSLLKVDAGAPDWTYQLPILEIQDNDMISMEENNE